MSATTLDLDHLRTWIGRTETASDVVSEQLCRALRATLDLDPGNPGPGDPTPPAVHWCLAAPAAPMHLVGVDGHPLRGGFLPPVPLPRRMWAGGRLDIQSTLEVGDRVTRRSTIRDVILKEGRTGALCFVTVEHAIATQRGDAILERQDIVYREIQPTAAPLAATKPGRAAQWSRSYEATPVLLFRYSALTFNSHRIHYDHPYTTQIEGYDDLVVHGPLIATFLLEDAQHHNPGHEVAAFNFKAVRPLTCHRLLRTRGHSVADDGSAQLWAEDETGALLMQATVQFR